MLRFCTFALAALLAGAGPALLPGVALPAAQAQAQAKLPLTLEDIWAKPTFRVATVPGFNWMRDGRYYSSLDDGSLVQHEAATGKALQTLVAAADLKLRVDNYALNADEQKVLFSTDTEPIYRRSTRATYYVYDRAARRLMPLSPGGKQSYATFSPDGQRVAFVRGNNLYVTELATMRETSVTTDGAANKLIHGSCDWVYEEEFEFAQAFFWSPDSRQLAFYSFDESQVPEYNMQEWGALYPQDYRYKYPKAGEKNSVVSISSYDVASARTTKMDVGPEPDQYIPRVLWTQTPNLLSIRRLNRLQNKLEILHGDVTTGKTQVVLTDTDAAYVEVSDDDLFYLPGGRQFLFASEKDGYRHLYLYELGGKPVRQLTKGPWDVTKVEGIDDKAGALYFTGTQAGPTQRHLYRTDLRGGKLEILSELVTILPKGPPSQANDKGRLGRAGTDVVNMSPDCRYYLNYHSQAGQPQVVSLHEGRTGHLVKTLEDNGRLRQTLSQYTLGTHEFFSFTTAEGTLLNGWMIKPANFDPTKKYPVLLHCYGGPGSQTVKDDAGGGTAFTNYLWHQLLAQQGYLVVSVDGRGTGGRGAAFKKSTYAQLGKLEAADQAAAGRYLATLPYVDASRLGLWGWSFGGYLTALTLTQHPEVFRMGISVAPVTNWRYYDTVYTERFLKTPQLNPGGYDDNSPVQLAQHLRARYLLVHGTGDDNVHFQNSIAWVDALIKADKDYQTLYYPNRNHGIYGGNTRLHLYRQLTEFVKANL